MGKLFLGLELNSGVELVLAVDRGSSITLNDDSLVRHTKADAARELALGEEDLQLLGEAIDVDYLTVVEQARLEGAGCRVGESEALAVRELGGRNETPARCRGLRLVFGS